MLARVPGVPVTRNGLPNKPISPSTTCATGRVLGVRRLGLVLVTSSLRWAQSWRWKHRCSLGWTDVCNIISKEIQAKLDLLWLWKLEARIFLDGKNVLFVTKNASAHIFSLPDADILSTPKTQVQEWPPWNQKWPILVIANYWWMEMPKVSQGFTKPRRFCRQKAGRCKLWFLQHQDWIQWSSSLILIKHDDWSSMMKLGTPVERRCGSICKNLAFLTLFIAVELCLCWKDSLL